ncbi:sensor histidine kinase [Yinghuangia soli]|uniref:histidine kinase n=1 Tax=Yinghuangia soli TaxID=2908204 RepID=A0AA41Q5W6_9ACTN|nr:nitrate- and nitrite sensing domain-containing protein [Yinghuangia soli]MCF2532144.1 nitrate- and nitrite sensing domain-containing protein [Yinghuangia soli]
MRKFRPATIRGRLVTVLALALAAVLVLLGVLAAAELDAYRQAERTADDVDLVIGAQAVVHELQRERGLTNGLLAGRADYRKPLDEQRARTDRALSGFSAETAGLDRAGLDAARDRWARLPEIRAKADTGEAQRDPTFAYFTDGIAELVEAGAAPSRTRDTQLLRGLDALTALGDAKEAAARGRGFLNGVLSAGKFKGAEYQAFAEIKATHQAALARFRRSATAAQRESADAVLRSPAAQQALQTEQIALAAPDGRTLAGTDPAAWWASMTTVIDGMWTVQQSTGEEIRQRSADLRDEASSDLVAYLVFAALLVVGEVALTLIAVRSITRPLTLLAAEAEALASQRLPEVVARLRTGAHGIDKPRPVAVPPRSGREIRAVAEAFGRVQDTAVELAAEQAVLRRNTTDSLVNLARRNQNLVRRQLGFISRLEHEEADPTALGNLFELDHLATRMRRNAESLLILVGEAGQRPSAAPLHITDVVRAALSEVEDYRRVVLRRMDEISVAGTVVAELAHLLAELVENALAFSPPDVEVEIYGRRVGNGYLVAVIDHGVGMSADAVETANARLSGRVDFLDAPTRNLGHYVVGRLAQRLGAEVHIGESPVAGITARVQLPPAVLADPTREAAPQLAPVGPRPLGPSPAAALGATSGPVQGPYAGTTALLPPPGDVQPDEQSYQSADFAPAEPYAAPPAAPAPVQRTRNGLTKRVPRGRVAPPPAAQAPVPQEPVEERSPEDVRSMLSAFRGGHLRGEVAEFGTVTQAPYRLDPPSTPDFPYPTPQQEGP